MGRTVNPQSLAKKPLRRVFAVLPFLNKWKRDVSTETSRFHLVQIAIHSTASGFVKQQ